MNDEFSNSNGEIRDNGTISKHKYDLEERTAVFGEEIIKFSKKIPVGPITRPLIDQIIRSGTSVGANYCEANDACSRKDFFHKIGICRKESKETNHWLRMMALAVPGFKNTAAPSPSLVRSTRIEFNIFKY